MGAIMFKDSLPLIFTSLAKTALPLTLRLPSVSMVMRFPMIERLP